MSLKRRTRAKEMSEFRDEKFHSDDVDLRSDWLLLRTEFSRVSITSNERPCTNHCELRYQKKIFYFKSQKSCCSECKTYHNFGKTFFRDSHKLALLLFEYLFCGNVFPPPLQSKFTPQARYLKL